MNTRITDKFNRLWLLLVLPILMGALYTTTISGIVSINDYTYRYALYFDFLILIPGLYFLIIRKTAIPKITMLPLFFLCTLIASKSLPEEDQDIIVLTQKHVLPLLEMVVLIYILLKIKTISRAYRKHIEMQESRTFYDALKSSCEELFSPKIAELVSMEISVFYYVFLAWKKQKYENYEWTYHKKSDTNSLLIGILILVTIETFALHFLLRDGWKVLDLIIMGLSIYTGIQILGILKSLRYRPHFLTDAGLGLRNGISGEIFIDYDQIKGIEINKSDMPKCDGHRKLSVLNNLDSHNLKIEFKSTQILKSIYGIKHSVDVLYVFVDDVDLFLNRVKTNLNE